MSSMMIVKRPTNEMVLVEDGAKIEVGECCKAIKKRKIGINSKMDVCREKRGASLAAKGLPRIRTRCPPICLHLMMKNLNDVQKNSIRDLGFDSMFHFNIDKIPSILGQLAVDGFDDSRCTLNVGGETVEITNVTIHEVLGFPMGSERITLLRSSKKLEVVTKEWRSQFDKEKTRIYPCNVYDIMVEQTGGGRMFQLNFLVLLVTIMGEGNQNGTVNQKFLPFVGDLSKVKQIDWCSYILECLKRSKKGWDTSKHFNGPLTLLVVIFANAFKKKNGMPNRVHPIINMWSGDELLRVEKEIIELDGDAIKLKDMDEVEEGDSESNTVMNQGEKVFAKVNKDRRKQDSKGGVAINRKSMSIDNKGENVDGMIDANKGETHETSVQEYKTVVKKIFDVFENGLMEMEGILYKAIDAYPKDESLAHMKRRKDMMLNAYNMDSNGYGETKVLEANEPDSVYNTNDHMVKGVKETQFFNSPTVMKAIEIAEKKKTEMIEKGKPRKEVTDNYMIKSLASPDFNLYITQQMFSMEFEDQNRIRRLSFGENGSGVEEQEVVVKIDGEKETRIRDAHTSSVIGGQQNNVVGMSIEGEKGKGVDGKGEGTNIHKVTTLNKGMKLRLRHMTEKIELSPRNSKVRQRRSTMMDCDPKEDGRMKRVCKLPPTMLSPFILREVSLAENVTEDEKNTADCIFSSHRAPREIMFRTFKVCGMRVAFESMSPGIPIVKSAIEMWCVLLNYEERLRNPAKYGRVFCPPNMVTKDMMKDEVEYRKHADSFRKNMDDTVKNTTFKSLLKVDLVFFPMLNGNNWYVVCFNLRTHQLHILDNFKVDETNISKVYGNIPWYLSMMLSEYMTRIKHPDAKNMLKPGSKVLKMSWQTNSNLVECGVFAMRHMELYKGLGTIDFDVGLTTEGPKQKKQLDELRIKFLAKMLLSTVNLNKGKVEDEVDKYLKMPGFKMESYKANAGYRIQNRITKTQVF